MIKAVVFDLDDTLTPEIDYVKSGYLHVAKLLSERLNMPTSTIFGKLFELFTIDSRKVFNRFYDELEIPYSNDDIVMLVESYRKHVPSIEFYDDVIPCLEQLRLRGIRTGIITDGYKEAQRKKLAALGANRYFEHIIVTDELGKDYWKPHPMAFKLMRDKFELDFGEMMYVGDNPEKDFYIGKIYPITTVRINRNGLYSDASYLNGIRENTSITSLSELLVNPTWNGESNRIIY